MKKWTMQSIKVVGISLLDPKSHWPSRLSLVNGLQSSNSHARSEFEPPQPLHLCSHTSWHINLANSCSKHKATQVFPWAICWICIERPEPLVAVCFGQARWADPQVLSAVKHPSTTIRIPSKVISRPFWPAESNRNIHLSIVLLAVARLARTSPKSEGKKSAQSSFTTL